MTARRTQVCDTLAVTADAVSASGDGLRRPPGTRVSRLTTAHRLE